MMRGNDESEAIGMGEWNYGRIENGEKRALYWILGIIGGVLVILIGAGVLGIFGMYGQMGRMQQAQADTNVDVSRLQNEFDTYVLPRYRNGSP